MNDPLNSVTRPVTALRDKSDYKVSTKVQPLKPDDITNPGLVSFWFAYLWHQLFGHPDCLWPHDRQRIAEGHYQALRCSCGALKEYNKDIRQGGNVNDFDEDGNLLW